MSASITDKITDVRNGARPISARVITARDAADVTLHCNALTGWPTASKVHFVTYQIDTNSDPIAGTQLDCYGIVSGSDITSVTVVDGTDGGNSIGDVVEMLPTAAWGQDLADALMVTHERTGAFSAAGLASIGAAMYPVGSIYVNASVATNPATLLGFGTWTAFGSGRVMVGVDGAQSEFDTLGETGGAKTHTHALSDSGQAKVAGISTSLYMKRVAASYNSNHFQGGFTSAANQTDAPGYGVGLMGTTDSDSTLQPYITVYMWKRTA